MKLRSGYDVVVVGGGTAGAIAGIAAARSGAQTLLVEQYGTLGGVLSLGMSLKGVYDGEGFEALGGIGRELLERARMANSATTAVSAHPRHGSIMGQDPEALKLALFQMASESGLNLLLHAFLVDTLCDGPRVQAVQVATKAGLEIIPANCFVDCTGDADLAVRAGARCTVGRESDGGMQPVSAIFRVGGGGPGENLGLPGNASRRLRNPARLRRQRVFGGKIPRQAGRWRCRISQPDSQGSRGGRLHHPAR